MQHLRKLIFSGLATLTVSLAGCGVGSLTTETGGTLHITGNVHGGIQPITGASVQMYAAGSGGNGSRATALLASPVFTDQHSEFSLTAPYTCPSAGTQVYLVATGGNPGFSTSVNNPALVLVATLGNCGDLASSSGQTVAINEVSTVSAAYALAAFMSAADGVGASATNATGIANAFLNAHLLADPATGMAAKLPGNLSVETGKLYALADALVPCVNSDGGAACRPLFSAATVNGSAPADVLAALLNIVKHPGNNVGAVYRAIGSAPPYPTALSTAPSDWTMSLSVSGGGLRSPTSLAIDKAGNVWVANYGDPGPSGIAAFSPQGTPLTGSPFGTGVQSHAYGLALDKNGDIWESSIDNLRTGGAYGSVAKFMGAGSSTPGALVGQFTNSTVIEPASLATDPAGSGTVLVGSYQNGLVSVFDLNGSFLKSLGSGDSGPKGIDALASDNAGGAWAADQGDSRVVHAAADGSSTGAECCLAARSLALDPHGNVWATSGYSDPNASSTYTFSELSAAGSVLIDKQAIVGSGGPAGAAVDAGGQFWIASRYSAATTSTGVFTEIAGADANVAAGTTLSPSSGFGMDARMSVPYGIAADASGNLWISVSGGDSLRMFFGMATPTVTPATPLPQAP